MANLQQSCAACTTNGTICEFSLANNYNVADPRCMECTAAGVGCVIPTDDKGFLDSGVNTVGLGRRRCIRCAVNSSNCEFASGYRPYPCMSCMTSGATGCMIPLPTLSVQPQSMYGYGYGYGDEYYNDNGMGNLGSTGHDGLMDQYHPITLEGTAPEQPGPESYYSPAPQGSELYGARYIPPSEAHWEPNDNASVVYSPPLRPTHYSDRLSEHTLVNTDGVDEQPFQDNYYDTPVASEYYSQHETEQAYDDPGSVRTNVVECTPTFEEPATPASTYESDGPYEDVPLNRRWDFSP
ncbi:hypothetical protein F4677DRAFT_451491 [Hypoxylon crocopeplum]|nr:hypothetical protein F4677DRAFT_451491 [Hypoxylon crocopeplum]